MVRSARMRMLMTLGLALVACGLVASPAAGATPIVMCSGTCGNYVLSDQSGGPYGAVCQYEKGSYDLDFISVRPPKVYGPYSYNTKVQWQVKVLRSTNFGGSYSSYYTSNWQSAMANKNSAAYAGHGFARRYWYAPDPNPMGYFKVRVLMRWQNSGGNVTGNAKIEYDYYKGTWNGQVSFAGDHCSQDFQG